eukprot:917254-Pyramimonas_sp.AAC.1
MPLRVRIACAAAACATPRRSSKRSRRSVPLRCRRSALWSSRSRMVRAHPVLVPCPDLCQRG